jgi:hypothetical protein
MARNPDPQRQSQGQSAGPGRRDLAGPAREVQPAPGACIASITTAYQQAHDATEALTRQLASLTLDHGMPSAILARARAATRMAPALPTPTRDTPGSAPAPPEQRQPDLRRPGTVESQVIRTGTSDPGLLLHAVAIDRRARALIAQATHDASRKPATPGVLPAAARSAVSNGHAPATSTRRTRTEAARTTLRPGPRPARGQDGR